MNPNKQEPTTRTGESSKLASLETHALTRETILGLLSDDEVAKVSTAETAAGVADGDEYLDLQALDQGVKRARGATAVSMGRILPRKAVHEATWTKILAELRGEGAARPPARR